MIFNGTAYGYLYNLQGDVVALVNTGGTKVVEYTYDAWGYPLSKTGTLASTLGTVQPFRYRGYVYDEETQLYYLRSRYYRPSWGRFINADSIVKGNLYCYCSNTPIMRIDSNGDADKKALSSLGKKTRKSMCYLRDALISNIYLEELYKDIEVYPDKGHIRIPNNTRAARKFLNLATDARSDYFVEHDWANMMAKVAIRKYRDITGSDYEQDTGISIEKVTFEIRVHEQLYEANIFPDHTDITDILPGEGKGWIIHVQTIIDLLYDLRLR